MPGKARRVETEPPTPAASLEGKADDNGEGPEDDRPHKGCTCTLRGAGPAIQRTVKAFAERSAFEKHYTAVPRTAIAVQLLAIMFFCLAVTIRLWTWGECPLTEIRQSCAVRAFPIFMTYDGEDDWSCRSCACNTLFYVDSNCTMLSAANRSSVRQAGAGGGCHAHNSARPRYASEILSSSPVILRPAATVFITACPSDIDLLRIISLYAQEPALLQFEAADEKVTAGTNGTFSWSFPPNFGHRPGGGDELWPLTYFQLYCRRNGRGDHHRYRTITLSLPEVFGRMSGLRHFGVWDLGLSRAPSFLARLTNLRELSLSHNSISDLQPHLIEPLKHTLRWLYLVDNRFSSVPAVLAEITGLKFLNLGSNSITYVPDFLRNLEQLKELRLSNNSITISSSSSIGLLYSKTLIQLRLDRNLLTAVPSTLALLTSLRQLHLGNNPISMMPQSLIKSLPDLKELKLDHTRFFSLSTLVELTSLAGLEKVWLNDNAITHLPTFLGELAPLEHLSLANTLISVFPSFLGKLTNLEFLDLGSNLIPSVPSSPSFWQRLVKLE